MLDHPCYMADLLRAVHGPEEALVRAAGCTSTRLDRLALIKAALKTARADCQDGWALIVAAEGGHEAVVRLLLGWREHAPRADCRSGQALIEAAAYGHEAVVRLLLGWREHAPRADCRDGHALILAAEWGHEAVVHLLLQHWQLPTLISAAITEAALRTLASRVVSAARSVVGGEDYRSKADVMAVVRDYSEMMAILPA